MLKRDVKLAATIVEAADAGVDLPGGGRTIERVGVEPYVLGMSSVCNAASSGLPNKAVRCLMINSEGASAIDRSPRICAGKSMQIMMLILVHISPRPL